MTPAIRYLEQNNIAHQIATYSLENASGNYGQDAADALGVPRERLFKTLLVSLNDEPKKLAVCIIPVSRSLNLKLVAKCFKSKKATMADPRIAEKTTGYVVGGISPFGQKRRLPTAIDKNATTLATLYCSGGKRGIQIIVSPMDLIASLDAIEFELSTK